MFLNKIVPSKISENENISIKFICFGEAKNKYFLKLFQHEH